MNNLQNGTEIGSEYQKEGKIDFRKVKEDFSLVSFCEKEGFSVKRNGSRVHVVCCPFHNEDTPSCQIYDKCRFTCFGCGAKGDVLDFVLRLNPHLKDSPAAAAIYLIGGDPSSYISSSTRNSPRQAPVGEPAARRMKRKTEEERIVQFVGQNQLMSIGDQIFYPQFSGSYRFADRRGWLRTPIGISNYMIGAMMAGEKRGPGEKRSFLESEPAIAFPKLIQTRRTAEVFGLENEFEKNGRILCTGIKKRLLPSTIEKWQSYGTANPPKWLAQSGFITEIPWEFDANEDAEVLVITEGPGDGLRLFNEANYTNELKSRYGNKWHITAADTARIWNVNSMPRRPMSFGSQNYSVSFFDGFRHIVLLLDGDEPGRKGATDISELIRLQNPDAVIWNVVIGENRDVCDFFDGGGTMTQLGELIKASPRL